VIWLATANIQRLRGFSADRFLALERQLFEAVVRAEEARKRAIEEAKAKKRKSKKKKRRAA